MHKLILTAAAACLVACGGPLGDGSDCCSAQDFYLGCGPLSGCDQDDPTDPGGDNGGATQRYGVTMKLRNQSPSVGRCSLSAKWTEHSEIATATALNYEYVTPEQIRSASANILGWVPVTFTAVCDAQNRPEVPRATTQFALVLTKNCMVDTAYRITYDAATMTYSSAMLYVTDC